MEYNKILFGKIRTIDNELGIGEIITPEDSFRFLLEDKMTDLEAGDIVSFRAEQIDGKNRAFFINKIEESKLYNNIDDKYKLKNYK